MKALLNWCEYILAWAHHKRIAIMRQLERSIILRIGGNKNNTAATMLGNK